MIKTISLALLAIIALETTAQTLTPAETAAAIFEKSPQAKIISLSGKAEQEEIKTENNFPDPELRGEYLIGPSGATDRWGAEISWGLEWPGIYSIRNKTANGQVDASRKRLEAESNKLLVDIKRLLANYILEEKQLEILKSVTHANDSMLKVFEKANEGGSAINILDVNKLKVESLQSKTALNNVMSQREITISSLRGIYGEDPSPILSFMKCDFANVPLPPGLLERIESSPVLISAKAEARVADLRKKLAINEGLPNISIGYRHAFEDGIHFNGPALGISIPIFSNRGKVKAAETNRQAAIEKVESLKTDLSAQLTSSIKRYGMLQNYVSEISPVILNPDNFRLLEIAFNGGHIRLSEYLRERSFYLNAGFEVLNMEYNIMSIALDIEEIMTIQ